MESENVTRKVFGHDVRGIRIEFSVKDADLIKRVLRWATIEHPVKTDSGDDDYEAREAGRELWRLLL